MGERTEHKVHQHHTRVGKIRTKSFLINSPGTEGEFVHVQTESDVKVWAECDSVGAACSFSFQILVREYTEYSEVWKRNS